MSETEQKKYEEFASDLQTRAERIALGEDGSRCVMSVDGGIADTRRQEPEPFESEHVWLAMDQILFGPAYHDGRRTERNEEVHEEDNLDVKIQKLMERARAYRYYDRYMAEKGFRGNREIDAAIIRNSFWTQERSNEIRDAAIEISDEEQGSEKYRVIRDRLALSLMCKTNGLFLGREVLNKDFTFYAHAPVFDFFVQKNPYLSISAQDSKNKIRLLQMPRGSYKSTADGVDTAQWVILDPDIRIMFLTASLSLAKDFVKEVKGFFTLDLESGLTPFQYLFKEDYRIEQSKKSGEFQQLDFTVPEGKEGKETEFICPARTRGDRKQRNVTIWAGSVGAGKVGKHCDVLKTDDAVDEKNSETPTLIAKTKKRIGMASKLVDPGGYRDNLGTPYAPNDWWNHVRTSVSNVLTLIRPCKTLRKDINGANAIQRGIGEKEIQPYHWNLLFPVDKNGKEKLSHKALQTAQEEDPEGFPSQYMLDSSGYKKVSFTEALLMQQTITRDQMPSQIEPFACYVLGDLADTTNSTSDYSVLAIMLVDKENRGFIVEVYRDRYSQYEICNLIAKINHDHKPIQIIIEDARGASKMKGDIQRASQDLGDKQIPLNFVKVNNTKGAKAIRVGKLEGKLRDRILFFLNSIDCYQDLIAEFRDFGSAPHDDIPDAIGFCEYVLPDLRGAPQDPNAAEAAQRIMNEKAFFEMIHGSPEDAIRHEMIEPMPETIIDESPDDLWDPFSAGTFRK